MRAGASLQTEKARRQIDETAHQLVARYLDAQGDGAALVDEVEGVLAEIEADRGDGFG
jgi:hypothetical protein